MKARWADGKPGNHRTLGTSPTEREVRSVLTRARTARGKLDHPIEPDPDNPIGMVEHPDAEAMREALDQVIKILDPWRKPDGPNRMVHQ